MYSLLTSTLWREFSQLLLSLKMKYKSESLDIPLWILIILLAQWSRVLSTQLLDWELFIIFIRWKSTFPRRSLFSAMVSDIDYAMMQMHCNQISFQFMLDSF
jgi:hypothetical protein